MFVKKIIAIESLQDNDFKAWNLFENYHIKYKDVRGPIIEDCGDHFDFTWYKVLSKKDTAKIYASVYKNIFVDIYKRTTSATIYSSNFLWDTSYNKFEKLK